MINKIKKLFCTGFFHIFGSSVINKIVSFMSNVVLVHILTKNEYGVFTYGWNIYGIIVLFSGMGIQMGFLQLASEHSGDTDYAEKISNYGTRFGAKFNIILLVIILGIGLFAPLEIKGGSIIICSLCFLPILQFLCEMMFTYLRSQKRNQDFAKLSVFHTLLVFTASVGCALLFREIGLVIGHYVAYFGAIMAGAFVFRIKLINRKQEDKKEYYVPLLKISFISMINNGLAQLMYLLDIFVLGIVDPQETILASYKVATMIPVALTFIPTSLITYLYPYFANHNEDGKWCIKRYRQVLLGLGGVNLIVSSAMYIFAPVIIKMIYGSQYLDAVLVFRILSVNYFFSGTFRILSGNLLVTQKKLKFNMLVAIVSSITNIIADYLFIHWWGALGAAYATVLVVFVSSIMSTVYLLYTFKQKAIIQKV